MVYSRMNSGQVIDGAIAKTVMYCDRHIRENPGGTKETINWLNECIIKYLSDDRSYYNSVQKNIVDRLDDKVFQKKFIDNVRERNLFIEGPGFSHIDLDNLRENWVSPNESVLIKKETVQYMKDKLKLKNNFTITQDIVRDNIFCVPMYTTALYKLTKNIISTRDFGSIRTITGQPTRGRAQRGGSRLGYYWLTHIVIYVV